MSATIKVEGLDDALRGLDPAHAARAVLGIRLGVAEEVRHVISTYPPPPKYPLRWASQKQRWWFKCAVREGRIQVPYARQFALTSQRLGPAWTVANGVVGTQATAPDAAWTVANEGRIVGTRVTYAPYVQSAAHQQPFHADTGWKTDEQTVQEVKQSGAIQRIVKDVLHKVFAGR